MVYVFKGTKEQFDIMSKEATITPEQLAECKRAAKMIPHADSLSYKLKKFIEKRMEEFSDDQSAYGAYCDILLQIEEIEGD